MRLPTPSVHTVLAGVSIALLAACATAPVPPPLITRTLAPTDCTAWVGTDRNATLPGYLLPQALGGTACVPLLLTANKAPPRLRGRLPR